MKDTTEKTENNNNFSRSKNSENSISGENRNTKNSAQITDFDFSQSERDYFISTKHQSDNNENEDSYVEKNGNKNGKKNKNDVESGDIENGFIKYTSGETGKLKVIDNYVVWKDENLKNSTNENYNRNNVNNNNNKNVKTKVKNTTLYNNIHYNGIDNIIVQNTSPPIKRNSPSNLQYPKGVNVGSSNVALNLNSRVVHDEYDWNINNNKSDNLSNDNKYGKNGDNNSNDNDSNDNNSNRKQSNNIKYGKPTVV